MIGCHGSALPALLTDYERNNRPASEPAVYPSAIGQQLDLRYPYRFVRDDLFRLSVFWHRDVHGYIATAQQSGSHWLANLLSTAICSEYDIPPLKNIQDKVVIGHPRVPATYSEIPRLVRTHHGPSPLVHAAPLRWIFRYPRYVILVRDIRAAMVSRYEKHRTEFDQSFSDYLRDHRPAGRKSKWDLYKRISFFNAWGGVCAALPDRTCVVRYEDLQDDAPAHLERIWRFLNLPVSDPDLFKMAAERCTKAHMSEKEQPGRTHNLVRMDERDPTGWFSEDDRTYFTERCRAFLKYDFGYDFSNWSTVKRHASLPST